MNSRAHLIEDLWRNHEALDRPGPSVYSRAAETLEAIAEVHSEIVHGREGLVEAAFDGRRAEEASARLRIQHMLHEELRLLLSELTVDDVSIEGEPIHVTTRDGSPELVSA